MNFFDKICTGSAYKSGHFLESIYLVVDFLYQFDCKVDDDKWLIWLKPFVVYIKLSSLVFRLSSGFDIKEI